jgi:uncharacterized Ntn-hydrolase superfamily protein
VLASEDVWPAVVEAFEARGRPLAARLLDALDTAEAAGAANKDVRVDAMAIPRLVTDHGEVLSAEDEILPWLEAHFDERGDAGAHREKAREEVPELVEVVAS